MRVKIGAKFPGTVGSGVFEAGSSFCVGLRGGGVGWLFFGGFLVVLAILIFAGGRGGGLRTGLSFYGV